MAVLTGKCWADLLVAEMGEKKDLHLAKSKAGHWEHKKVALSVAEKEVKKAWYLE